MVDEILFGALREGGSCMLTAKEAKFLLELAPDNTAAAGFG